MKIKVCDLCGEPIDNASEYYRTPKTQMLGMFGWETIDVHRECREKLFNCKKKNAPVGTSSQQNE